MSSFRRESITFHLGYDCSSLSPSAHALENTVEFKRAAQKDFDRHFDVWTQDRSFTTPYAGRTVPGTLITPDSYGDVDASQVLDMVREHLQAHARSATVDVTPGASSTCIWNKELQRWIVIGSYRFTLDGSPATADGAIAGFEVEYRANRPSIPADFDDDLDALRALRTTAFVHWPV